MNSPVLLQRVHNETKEQRATGCSKNPACFTVHKQFTWMQSAIEQTHIAQQIKGYERKMPQLRKSPRCGSLEAARISPYTWPTPTLFFTWVLITCMRGTPYNCSLGR